MKSHLLLAAAMFAASVATQIESLAQERPMQTMTMRAHPLPVEGTLPSLAGASTWLNSQPLTPEALRGKVGHRRRIGEARAQPFVKEISTPPQGYATSARDIASHDCHCFY